MRQKLLILLWWALGFALLAAVACLIFVHAGDAQTTPTTAIGPIPITAAQCARIAPGQNATVFIQVTGTWTGTLQPEASVNGQTPFNLQVVPGSSTVPQSTITANGGYSTSIAGFSTFLVCGNTVASGTANVYLNLGSGHR